MRECSNGKKCVEPGEKPLSEFYPHPTSVEKRMAQCAACCKHKERKRYASKLGHKPRKYEYRAQ